MHEQADLNEYSQSTFAPKLVLGNVGHTQIYYLPGVIHPGTTLHTHPCHSGPLGDVRPHRHSVLTHLVGSLGLGALDGLDGPVGLHVLSKVQGSASGQKLRG